MEDNIYLEDGATRILNLMRDTFGDTFVEYFDSELLDIPHFSLPCIMVTTNTGTVASDATGTDKIVEEITIMLVLNKKDDLGAKENADLTDFKIRKMVMGQDPQSSYPYIYLPKTVMAALRTYISLDDTAIQSNIGFEFGPGVRGENLATQEGHVTITIERRALVPQRQ